MPAATKIKPLVRTNLSTAVSSYINAKFNGNLTTAAKAIDCNYDGLRNTALGTSRRVNLPVVQALARHSGRSIEWWLE